MDQIIFIFLLKITIPKRVAVVLSYSLAEWKVSVMSRSFAVQKNGSKVKRGRKKQ